ncbi:hypothetical protein [Cupriavidus metallidurans]|uniref:hypothetical protein n=1 Tax=Cupriavidus metallidurans TaxID=119219 RepID=UPI000AA403D1|nr:hypothetical protein [Cupriavidus metallidurans]
MIALNDTRRHLTTAQRAAIAAELANMANGRPKKTSSNDDVSPAPVSLAQAAQALNVSKKSVERAKTVMRKNPAAHEAAKRGQRLAP